MATCRAVAGRDSCPSLAGKDDMQNYMVATADTCRNHFTPGQVNYMQTVIRAYKPTLMRQLLPECVAAIDDTDYSPDLQPCLPGTVRTSTSGRSFCRTDPDSSAVWAWACCPSSLNWDQDSCRQGTPNFALPGGVLDAPRSSGTGGSPTSTRSPTRQPTDSAATLTRSPTIRRTKSPTKYPTRAPTKVPTLASVRNKVTSSPSTAPSHRPTKRPIRRRRRG
jgi:hypothetical protein